MEFPFIKICGIQTMLEASICVEAGATAIGCLVGLTHKAEDKVTAEQASRIFALVPRKVLTVMVTHLTLADDILAFAKQINPRAIQVHGDTSPEEVGKLSKVVGAGVRLIKNVHVMSSESVSEAVRWDAEPVSAVLLDSRTADRLGGTGQTHDWRVSAKIVDAVRHPVILAGGLNPGNVAQAIEIVRSSGVDVNSGVENADGSKSISAVREFIQNAQAAFKRLPHASH
jgi:phosphoribosylanthranilate isomerase